MLYYTEKELEFYNGLSDVASYSGDNEDLSILALMAESVLKVMDYIGIEIHEENNEDKDYRTNNMAVLTEEFMRASVSTNSLSLTAINLMTGEIILEYIKNISESGIDEKTFRSNAYLSFASC
jgi:hypothetical protein